MSDLSPRRRLAGRALLGAGLLALPLTASISYAASEASAVEAPEPPAPPAPPSAPDAPEPPLPPEAPEAPEPPTVIVLDGEGAGETEVTERVWKDADGKERRMRMVFRAAPDGQVLARQFEATRDGDPLAHEEMMAALREGLAEADRVRAELPQIIAEAMASADAANAVAAAGAPRVIVKQECKGGSEEVSETTTRDGTQIISICQKRVFVSARKGLEEARAEIASDKDIPEATRKEILRTLDSQIARWKDREG